MLVRATGWSVAAVVIAASGLVIAGGLWWAYYLVPTRTILERWPERTFPWRYAHLPLFGAIAAVGAGLRVAAEGVEHEMLSLLRITLALAVPVGLVIILVFLLWSVLVNSFDRTHLPLFVGTLVPIAAAVVIAAVVVDPHSPTDFAETANLVALVTVIALVSLSCVVEVVGHEMVGYSHTLRAVRRNLARPESLRRGRAVTTPRHRRRRTRGTEMKAACDVVQIRIHVESRPGNRVSGRIPEGENDAHEDRKARRPPARTRGPPGPSVRCLQLREAHAVQHQVRHVQVAVLQPVGLLHKSGTVGMHTMSWQLSISVLARPECSGPNTRATSPCRAASRTCAAAARGPASGQAMPRRRALVPTTRPEPARASGRDACTPA